MCSSIQDFEAVFMWSSNQDFEADFVFLNSEF